MMRTPQESRKAEIELLKIKVDVWKQVINTQQHFNDLSMRIRNFAILILSAFIGAIGVSFKSGFWVPIFGHPTSVSTILSFGASIIWLLFFFVDLYWYHPLLVGSVKKGMVIENRLKKDLDGIIDLTHTVGKESPKNLKISVFGKCLFSRDFHSKGKAKVFYYGVFAILLVISVIMFFVDKPILKEDYHQGVNVSCKRLPDYSGFSCAMLPK